jgi:hypothetical protein
VAVVPKNDHPLKDVLANVQTINVRHLVPIIALVLVLVLIKDVIIKE